MKYLAIDLQRISLGALVIALGMLVDNAIVVVEGILIGTQKGERDFKLRRISSRKPNGTFRRDGYRCYCFCANRSIRRLDG